jgi:hypothetical protein
LIPDKGIEGIDVFTLSLREAMDVRDRPFRTRASRIELVKNLLLMLALFGTLMAIVSYVAGLPLLTLLVFVGIALAAVTAIITVLLAL